MINVGDNNISGVYLGDEELSVYIGDELIYPLNFGTLTAITLTNLTWVTDIPYSGGTGTSANCSYIITGYYDSGKTRKLNRFSVVDGEITASSTTSSTRDLVGTLVLTATCSGLSATGSVDAYQEAYVVDYSTHYMTMRVISGGTIEWLMGQSAGSARVIEYSKDNGANWTSITSTTQGAQIQVSVGDVILFRGNNTKYHANSYDDRSAYRNAFQITGSTVILEGNIMSMLNGDNFIGTTLTSNNTQAFENFFFKCTGIQSAENLIMPSSTTQSCCFQMFYSCSTMTSAPALPAAVISRRSYYAMFQNCSNLNYIKCLATDRTAYECTLNWVQNVAASGTFVKKAGYTEWSSGNNGIPSGWTVLEE